MDLYELLDFDYIYTMVITTEYHSRAWWRRTLETRWIISSWSIFLICFKRGTDWQAYATADPGTETYEICYRQQFDIFMILYTAACMPLKDAILHLEFNIRGNWHVWALRSRSATRNAVGRFIIAMTRAWTHAIRHPHRQPRWAQNNSQLRRGGNSRMFSNQRRAFLVFQI